MGDPLELAAVEEVIRNSKRTTPLLVGSIKSNVSMDVEPQTFEAKADETHRLDISKVLQDSQA